MVTKTNTDKMKYTNIKRALVQAELKHILQVENRVEQDLNATLQWHGKTYKGTPEEQKTKFMRWIRRRYNKRTQEALKQLERVAQAEEFKGLTVTLEWSRGNMQAMQAKPYASNGFEGSKTGGYGYCKESTATAEAFNQYLPLMKLLYDVEEQRLSFDEPVTRREFIGYGSGNGELPYFEGGVGFSAHRTILEGLGLEVRETGTPKTNTYIITRRDC